MNMGHIQTPFISHVTTSSGLHITCHPPNIMHLTTSLRLSHQPATISLYYPSLSHITSLTSLHHITQVTVPNYHHVTVTTSYQLPRHITRVTQIPLSCHPIVTSSLTYRRNVPVGNIDRPFLHFPNVQAENSEPRRQLFYRAPSDGHLVSHQLCSHTRRSGAHFLSC